jgi:DNA polymerase-3 subunit beta
MNLTIESTHLAAALAKVQGAASASSTMPILTGVLLSATETLANFAATDLERFAFAGVPATVERPGKAVLPARLLSDITRSLPAGPVEITATGTKATVKSGRNKWDLAVYPADDFPEWPAFEPQCTFSLPGEKLRTVIQMTEFAIPQRDPRKVLMGVLFDVGETGLTAVATDGRKLGRYTVKEVTAEPTQAIIPAAILPALKAACEDGEVEIAIAPRMVRFTFADVTYLAAVVEGAYPKYQAVIPSSFNHAIPLAKSALLPVLSRAQVVAERKHHSVVLRFTEGRVDVTAQSEEVGQFEGACECGHTGEALRMAFNHHYLADILKVAPGDALTLRVKAPDAPVVFECEDPDALLLAMPVRMADAEKSDD